MTNPPKDPVARLEEALEGAGLPWADYDGDLGHAACTTPCLFRAEALPSRAPFVVSAVNLAPALLRVARAAEELTAFLRHVNGGGWHLTANPEFVIAQVEAALTDLHQEPRSSGDTEKSKSPTDRDTEEGEER